MIKSSLPTDSSTHALLFKHFCRSVAEIQWLLVILVLLYVVATGYSLDSSPSVLITIGLYFLFSLATNYAGLFDLNRSVLITAHTLVMMAFITTILYLTHGIDGPLVSLYLVVIITSALALGKMATLLEVGAVAACYLLLTQYADSSAESDYSLIAANLLIFILVGYLTTTLAEAIHSANEHLKTIPRLEHGLEATVQRWKYVVQQSSDAFIEVDSLGQVTEWNPRASSLFGWSEDEAVGQNLRDLIIPPQSRQAQFNNLQQYFNATADNVMDRRVKAQACKRDGTVFTVEVLIHDFQMPDQRYFNAFLHDISDRERQHTRLIHKAHIDAVTQLANRYVFEERLAAVLGHDHPGTISLLFMIDLDNFKAINDRHGHTTGDRLLREVGERILGVVRDNDLVARLGGDEFVVLMEQLKPLDDAKLMKIANKLVDAIDQPYLAGHQAIEMTASVGVAVHPGDANTAEELLNLADQAMYRAKQAGKNRYRIENRSPGSPAIL
ncbi:diguanylate cyclase domain-containing protein [Salinisphaera aquimarina]|uniref:Diguanylate cyclase domain-containing protein n=1 Tax=Salinisphaera aquimarina TaxID=2094031 RepID=A0ABV7EWE7_9GAMM